MTDNNVMTLAALRKFAAGVKPLTDAQYASATATANGSHVSARATLALVAYGVSERGITGLGSAGESMTRLAADTLPTADHSPKAWRSTLSKYAGAVRYAVTAGVLAEIDPAGIDRLVRGYDSTADGRKILSEAATAAAGKDDALAVLLAAADAAIASKAAARKGNGNVPDKGEDDATGESKREAKPNDGAPTVTLSWLETLAVLASAAPAQTAALDADSLALAAGLIASIGDALADASATVEAALATAKSKRK